MVVKFTNENSSVKSYKHVEKKFVEVSFEYIGIGEVNTMHENYHAELIIESTWLSDDANIKEYDPEVDWNPNLFIYNVIKIKEENISYKINRASSSKCYITEIRKVKGCFWDKFVLQDVKIFYSINSLGIPKN